MGCMRQICVHTHIYDYVVYELPSLPNNAANEVFLHKSGRVFIMGRRPSGDKANT
jgi:hypothetical protein